MKIRTVALFTADPWESAMPRLRVMAPAALAGIQVLRGNDVDTIFWDSLHKADVLIFQRDFPRFGAYDHVLRRARDAGKSIVYEVDDQLLDLPSWHVSFAAVGHIRDRLLRGAIDADIVVTSTPMLQATYRHYNPRTYIFPNYLDDSLWSLREPDAPEGDRPVVIGYMGGGSHRPDLETIAPVLVKLAKEWGDGVKLRFWGVRPPDALMALPNVEWHGFDLLSYMDFIRQFSSARADIWIAPLRNAYFNRFKSHIKYLEYTALGGAGIYSRMEPYTGVVRDRENGLLAQEPDEWENALRRLIDDPELRHKLACAAQRDVREHWLLSRRYSDWVDCYENVIQSGKG